MNRFSFFLLALCTLLFVACQKDNTTLTTTDYRLAFTGTYQCIKTNKNLGLDNNGVPNTVTTIDNNYTLTVTIDPTLSDHIILTGANLLIDSPQSYPIDHAGNIEIIDDANICLGISFGLKANFTNNRVDLNINSGSGCFSSHQQTIVGHKLP